VRFRWVRKAEAGETGEPAEVLVKRQELEDRGLPTGDGQFQKQTERSGSGDGNIDVLHIHAVEKAGFVDGIGVEKAFEGSDQGEDG